MVRLIIPGRPPAKNDHKRVSVSKSGKPFPYTTARAKRFMKDVEIFARQAEVDSIDAGAWHCGIHIYYDRRCLTEEFAALAGMDVDAPVALVLDALQHANVIDDDARIVSLVVTKFYDKASPRVEVALWEASRKVAQ